ncbi:MAG TPA: CheR family methyltransferase [Pyrinomonadaceae bacterium]|nr:CheR family methyltransferase [Pyrinomonadaceae bacterium]
MQEVNGNDNNGLMLVGIGASAGGVEALMNFFEHTPDDSGLAFAVVLHAPPGHDGRLAEVLQAKTEMPVKRVEGVERVERNCVYCVPPETGVSLSGGHIRLVEADVAEPRPEHSAPVDLFFRELARTYKDRAFAVVLTGDGADGSLGLGRVREEGGVSVAQDPSEAEHPSMPQGAIGTGFVDFVLPVAAIPGKLVSLRRNAERIQLPPAEPKRSRDFAEDALRELLALLRARTRHDFSNYKRSTLLRRIERRLQVTESADLHAYLEHVRRQPEELHGLLRDLLISVTNFFRDPEAFRRLETAAVPRMFEGKGAGDQIRVWVTGCATGEEAYSLAMLLVEHADTLASPPAVQIFATDIDESALAQGRIGLYPSTIAADLSPERLKRFFGREGQLYRVRRELREMVLFAPHNLLRDPPFSRLDLVSCRNLLIYIDRQMQDRILEIFHFALKPDGFLFLGTSESVDGQVGLFAPAEKKHRIFKRVNGNSGLRGVPAPLEPGGWSARPAAVPPNAQPAGAADRALSFGEVHYRMLEAFAPPSVLINADYDIVHLSENAGRFLQFTGGDPSRNLLKVAHPDLRPELRTLLVTAPHEGGVTRRVLVKMNGGQSYVRISARPFESAPAARGFILVVFEEHQERATATEVAAEKVRADAAAADGLGPVVTQLEEELQRTRERLRATVEEYETSVEELRAGNEELQAMNEELRSASEELETSKEESQAVNEELGALNAELRDKIDEIGRVNSDLQNLLASTRVATLFLDRSLRVRRYTPSAQELFNLIPGDLGRPLAHVTHKLVYEGLVEDAETVISSLTVVEREVETAGGTWLTARLMPYRSVNDKIDGVVLTFTDIHERKEAEEELRASEERLRLVVESAEDYAIMLLDSGGRFTEWNVGAEKVFGYTKEEAVGQPADIIFTPEDRAAGVPADELRAADRDGRAADERWHVRKDGSRFYCSGVMVSLRLGRGYAKIARDLTAQKRMQEELERAGEQMEKRVEERTAELAEANSAMREEVKVRRRAERGRSELLRRVVTTQEDERRRISRELHDQLGQSLTALRLKLEGLKGEAGKRSKLQGRIDELVEIAQRLDSDVDFLAWELRPTALDDLGLIVALSNYAKEWAKHFNVKVNFHSAGLGDARLEPLVETSLYRVAQEALNNVAKHAGATRVDMMLERRDDNAVLIVEDDGRGFDAVGVEADGGLRGMGLISMRERASLVGGMVEIESAGGGGATVFVRVPIGRVQADGGAAEAGANE